MDLSHLGALRYKLSMMRGEMEILFLKKKKERKGYLLTRRNGVLEDIQTVYPLDAWKFFNDFITDPKNKSKSWHFMDDDQLKDLVSFDKSFDNFGSFQKHNLFNRIKQRIF